VPTLFLAVPALGQVVIFENLNGAETSNMTVQNTFPPVGLGFKPLAKDTLCQPFRISQKSHNSFRQHTDWSVSFAWM